MLTHRGSKIVGVFALATALLVAGCGTESARQTGDPSQRRPCGTPLQQELSAPAEAAESPEPSEQPAGRVVQVGRTAKGIVADERTGLVAVAQIRGELVLLNGQTGQIARRVPLPGRLRHLELQKPGGPVLVPVEGADALLRVTLPQGKVITNVPVGKFPHNATATASGAIAVANEFGGTMSVIENEQVVHTFGKAATPSAVDAIGQLVAMPDTAEDTISFYDIPARECIAELPAGGGPTHLVDDGERFFVSDTDGEAILVYRPEPQPTMVKRFELPTKPYGIAYDSGRDWLWVTLTARNQLVGIDVSDRQWRIRTRIPTVRSPQSVAVNTQTGRVFVASKTEGVVQLIDPARPGQTQG